MTKTNGKPAIASQSRPALILFGVGEKNKPRAGTFEKGEVETATKAAKSLGLSALPVTTDQLRDIAAKLSPGTLSATGPGLLPYVREDLHSELKQLAKTHLAETSQATSNSTTTPAETGEVNSQTGYRLPKSWDDIQVGDLVLAKDTDPENGWWEAIVVKKHGDMYTLQWRQALLPQRQRLVKHKFNLGLMWPGVDVAIETPMKNESRSAFPVSWKAIAAEHVVLAKEEGPMENWWDAAVTNSDSDDLSLRWVGFEALPGIKRPRLTLALLHPNPPGAKASNRAAA